MSRIIDQKNFVTGVLYMLLGSAVAFASVSYSIGTTASMGPGYFPALVGVLLALIGLGMSLLALSNTAKPSQIARVNPRPLVCILLAVVLFALLLKPAGAAIAIVVLTLVSSAAMERPNWRQVVLTALALIPVAYLIFVVTLGLRLRFLPEIFANLGV